jgi:hypothetical protein
VRYRPHVFDEIAGGKYGAFVTEFVAAQPEQLLYLLASEACQPPGDTASQVQPRYEMP